MKMKQSDSIVSLNLILGGTLVGVFVIIAIIGPWIAPYDPTVYNLDRIFHAPSALHWLGTDQHGIDLFSALLYGARMAFIISTVVVLGSVFIGVSFGLVAGYYRGYVDEVMMRIVDVFMSFPGILLNILVVAAVSSSGIAVTIVALLVNGWVGYTRVVRGQVLRLREQDYIVAVKSLGASPKRIMFRHLLPNIMPLILVQMSFGFGGVIAIEASLSFLGLGPQVDYTWGALLQQGSVFVWNEQVGFRLVMIPGLAIMAVVLGANLLGDALRDLVDPKRKKRR